MQHKEARQGREREDGSRGSSGKGKGKIGEENIGASKGAIEGWGSSGTLLDLIALYLA